MIIQLDQPRKASPAQSVSLRDDGATRPEFTAVLDQHAAEEPTADPTCPWFMSPPPHVPDVVNGAVPTALGTGSLASVTEDPATETQAITPTLVVVPEAPEDGLAATADPAPDESPSDPLHLPHLAVQAIPVPQAEVPLPPVATDTTAKSAPDGLADSALPMLPTAHTAPAPLQRPREGQTSVIVRRIDGGQRADLPPDDSADAPGPSADISRPWAGSDGQADAKVAPLFPAIPPSPEATGVADPLTMEAPPMQGPLFSTQSPLTGAVASAAPTAFPAPIIATLVAAASAATVSADRVEVILSPEELGRVRMDFRAEGAGVYVYLTAERQDTLDLLRRHADQLAAELRQAGYSGASLSFGQWGQQHDDGRARQRLALSPQADGRASTPLLPIGPGATSGRGLDLRI